MRNECPVCDNKNIKNIVGIKIKPFDDSPFDNFIDVASCPTCDFAYTKNISFDENDLERYYAIFQNILIKIILQVEDKTQMI